MLHTQLQHLPRDTFKFYLKHRDKFLRDATTQASPSMLMHLSSIMRVLLVPILHGSQLRTTNVLRRDFAKPRWIS